MAQCPYCGGRFIAGMIYCQECGKRVHDDQEAHDTLSRRATAPISPLEDRSDTEPVSCEALVIYVRHGEAPILVYPGQRIILGRGDTRANNGPDVDLTAYGALERGVSRRHAAIDNRASGPTITDMRSTNGVYINGMRLPGGHAYPLHDGDEIHLGDMVAHVYFEEAAAASG